MLNLKTLLIGGSLAIASIGTFAQADAPATPATPRVDQREANQEKRIEQGIASGQLNAKETTASTSNRPASKWPRPMPRQTARSPRASAST